MTITPDRDRYTDRAKKVLELSLREALQLGHNYIGTEHLLLALIREGEGIAAQVLVEAGVELTPLRAAVIQYLSGRREISEFETAKQELVKAINRFHLACEAKR